MAGTFTQRNRDLLAAELGREPTSADLYVAHFLGARGAVDLIRQAQTAPRRSAAAEFPDAAAANRPIFFDRKGRARGAGEVYALLAASHGTQAAASAAPAFAPDQPVAFARSDGPALHGLFRTDGRRGRSRRRSRSCGGPARPAEAGTRTAALGGVLSALDAAARRPGRDRARRPRGAGWPPASPADVPLPPRRPALRSERALRLGRGQPSARTDRAPARPLGLHELAAPGMIIRQFLLWARTAPPGQRAEAVGALARAYLYSDLSPEDRWEAETAMTALLDDPSPLGAPRARRGLRQCERGAAPPRRGARQRPERHRGARPVALAGAVGRRSRRLRGARRRAHPDRDRAAPARVGRGLGGACRDRLRRPRSPRSPATAAPRSPMRASPAWWRATAAARSCAGALLARADLPLAIRQAIAVALVGEPVELRHSAAAGSRRSAPSGSSARRARRRRSPSPPTPSARTCAASSSHLRRTGQLTPALILRALLLARHLAFAEAAFAELSGPARRAGRRAACGTARGAGFGPLYGKAGLPPSLAARLRGGALRASRAWRRRRRRRRARSCRG